MTNIEMHFIIAHANTFNTVANKSTSKTTTMILTSTSFVVSSLAKLFEHPVLPSVLDVPECCGQLPCHECVLAVQKAHTSDKTVGG